MRSKRAFRLSGIAVTVLFMMLAVSCGGFFTNPVLTSISVTPQSSTVQIGGTQQLTATGVNDDSSTSTLTNVTWTTSDMTIATVSSTGVVTGVANGTATITATSGAITGTATVNVGNAGVASITISPTNPFITSGQQQAFTATATTAGGQTLNVTSTAQWTSSNPSVATISPQGVAIGQQVSAAETTTITVAVGSVSASTTLTVNP